MAKIREVDPDFEPSAYLGGTVDPNSTKWLIGARMANMNWAQANAVDLCAQIRIPHFPMGSLGMGLLSPRQRVMAHLKGVRQLKAP